MGTLAKLHCFAILMDSFVVAPGLTEYIAVK
jgi:hypothetical protein